MANRILIGEASPSDGGAFCKLIQIDNGDGTFSLYSQQTDNDGYPGNSVAVIPAGQSLFVPSTPPGGLNTEVQYNAGGVFGGILKATSDGTSLFTLADGLKATSPQIINSVHDTNGNVLIGLTATASAVNSINITNAATGTDPVVSAIGANADVGLVFTPKGAGNSLFSKNKVLLGEPSGASSPATVELDFFNSASVRRTTFKAGIATQDADYTLPLALPTINGQALTSTTLGVMSWATVSATPAGADTQVQFNDGGTAFGADAEFAYDKTNNRLYIGSGVLVLGNFATLNLTTDGSRFLYCKRSGDGLGRAGFEDDGTNGALFLSHDGTGRTFQLNLNSATIAEIIIANQLMTGNFKLSTAGNGFYVKEGVNATMGTGTLNGATEVTINTTKVTATSRIFLSIQAPGGTPVGAIYVSSRIAGTSFGVKGTALDTSDFAWWIVEPA